MMFSNITEYDFDVKALWTFKFYISTIAEHDNYCFLEI